MALSIPPYIHVDPNMHPNIYKTLLEFALVFDKVSLYAVSGNCIERYCPLKTSELIDLVNTPKEAPFILTSPTDWYSSEERKKRVNQTIMGWSEFDDRVKKDVGLENVASVSVSKVIRDEAWEATFNYTDALLKEGIDSQGYNGRHALLHNAFIKAKWQFSLDRAEYEEYLKHSNEGEFAQFSYKGTLPAIFYQKVAHTDNYGTLLKDGHVLSCLIFEHLTKPQIISEINRHPEIKRQGLAGRFAMYVPDQWHSFLLNGIQIESSSDLIRGKFGLRSSVNDESLAASIVHDEFSRLFASMPEHPVTVPEIKLVRSLGMPEILRRLIAEQQLLKKDAKTPSDREAAMRMAVRNLRYICQSRFKTMQLTRNMVELLSKIVTNGVLLYGATRIPHEFEPLEENAFALVDSIKEYTRFDPKVESWLLNLFIRHFRVGREQFVLATLDRWLKSGQPSRVLAKNSAGQSPPESNLGAQV